MKLHITKCDDDHISSFVKIRHMHPIRYYALINKATETDKETSMKAILGIITTLIIALFLFFSMPYINDYMNATPFHSQKWIEAEKETEGNWKDRWNMRRDLLANYNLKGKSKEEIIKLLGKPHQESENEMYYSLGPATTGIDMGTLLIKFVNKKVQSYRVYSG